MMNLMRFDPQPSAYLMPRTFNSVTFCIQFNSHQLNTT